MSQPEKRQILSLLCFKDAKKRGVLPAATLKDLRSLIFRAFQIRDTQNYKIFIQQERSWVPLYTDFSKVPDRARFLVRENKGTRPKGPVIPVDWATYSNVKFGLSIRHPPNFVAQMFDFPGQPLTSVTFLNPESPANQIILMVEDHPIKLTVDEYYQKSMMSLQMLGGGAIQTIGQPVKLRLGGVKPPSSMASSTVGPASPAESSESGMGGVATDSSNTGDPENGYPAYISSFSVQRPDGGPPLSVWQGVVTYKGKRSFVCQSISPDPRESNSKQAELMFKSLKLSDPEMTGEMQFFSHDHAFTVAVPQGFQVKPPSSDRIAAGLVLEMVFEDGDELVESVRFQKHAETTPDAVFQELSRIHSGSNGFEAIDTRKCVTYCTGGLHYCDVVKSVHEDVVYVISMFGKTQETADKPEVVDSFARFSQDDTAFAGQKMLPSMDFVKYRSRDFHFALCVPAGSTIKEHSDVDPVVTMTPAKMHGEMITKNHYEIAVSCRGLPSDMTITSLYEMLESEYRENPVVSLTSVEHTDTAVHSRFKQDIQGLLLDFKVTCHLFTPRKCATVRTTRLDEADDAEAFDTLFAAVHDSFEFDLDGIQGSDRFKQILPGLEELAKAEMAAMEQAALEQADAEGDSKPDSAI